MLASFRVVSEPRTCHLQHVRCAPKLEPSLETAVEVPLATGNVFA